MIAKSLINLIKNYLNNYRGLQKECWKTIILNFINSTLIGIFYFLPLYFLNELRFSIVVSGFIISFYSLGTIFGGIIGGKLSDQLSPKFISIGSLLIQGAIYLALFMAKSVAILIILIFFLGISTYGFITSNFLWTLSYCNNKKEKIKSINLIETASNLGLGLAAIIIGIIANFSFRYLLLGASIILLLLSLYLILTYQRRLNFNEKIVSNIPVSDISKIKKLNTLNQLIVFVIINLFFAGIIISQLSSTYSIHLQTLFSDYGYGNFSVIFALNTFLIFLLQTPLANYFSKYNHIIIIGSGVFLLGFGMYMLAFSFSFYLAIMGCILYTLGEILFFSVAQLICYENAPLNKKGFVLGTYRMVYASSRAIGPALGAYVYEYLGNSILWFSCSVIGIFSLFSAIAFKRFVIFRVDTDATSDKWRISSELSN
ncbi:MFS transporter [Aquicella lusitana]|uniref:Putative MFS family arabinose efflux permease n=1 Tax=Aquicella lusitana TaxID=254246 RepID=A0A370GWL5_9COXI|nr:MFS transporter [Aquicella lusitana]RDI48068.1 putative MFS family arabinose efflux permease [Aquicella lusitana]VVC72916.1 hypothetical protein AQULUS_06400 [Aquicella lusitana]